MSAVPGGRPGLRLPDVSLGLIQSGLGRDERVGQRAPGGGGAPAGARSDLETVPVTSSRVAELELDGSRRVNSRGPAGLWAGSPLFGRNVEDLFGHSWSNPCDKWLWLPRGASHLELGFPAADVARFGSEAKLVVRSRAKTTDSRSFAEVVRGMKRGFNSERLGDSHPGRSGDRSPDRRGRHERWPPSHAGNHWKPGPREGAWSGPLAGGRRPNSGLSHAGNWSGVEELPPPPPLHSRGRGGGGPSSGGGPLRSEPDLRHRLNRDGERRTHEKSAPPSSSRPKKKACPSDKCFNCNRSGHFEEDCAKPPFCYNCKIFDHKAAVCPKRRALKLCGFGLPGQMFFSVRLPAAREERKKHQFLGLLTIREGAGSLAEVEAEFHHQFRGSPGWQIKTVQPGQFLISFPDEDMRRQLTRFRTFGFETSAITASVTATDMPFEDNKFLESVWVKATGFPSNAREPDIVNEVAFLVGDPLEIDLGSLGGEGPVRIRVDCREAAAIKGVTEVFFNGESRLISWQVEEHEKTYNHDKLKGLPKFDKKGSIRRMRKMRRRRGSLTAAPHSRKQPQPQPCVKAAGKGQEKESASGTQQQLQQKTHGAQECSNDSSHFMLSQSNPLGRECGGKNEVEGSASLGLDQVDYEIDTMDTADPTEQEIEDMKKFEEEFADRTEKVGDKLTLSLDKEMALQLEMAKYQKNLDKAAAIHTTPVHGISTSKETSLPRPVKTPQKIQVRQEPAVSLRKSARPLQSSSTPPSQHRTSTAPSAQLTALAPAV